MPEFPGGEMALRDFIVHNIKYPATALKDSIQGKVFITFVVKADGTVGNAKIARGVSISLDNEAIRVVNSLPAWKPGKVKGQAVPVSYTVPVKFALDGNKAGFKTVSDQAAAPPKQVDGVFVVVEQMPEFVGGQDELIKFLVKEIKYPENAKKNKITGKVFVSFVVSSNGKVEQAKIVKAVDPELDAEALRVINLMPHWKPGTQHGKAVSVAYTMPIMFALN
jgi:TonB family protein